MEGIKILRNSQIIILGVCIAAATIISSAILSRGFMKLLQFQQQVINVTGSAQKVIKSDSAVWRCAFSRREADLPTAYQSLQADLDKVKAYLFSKGIAESQIIVSQISTSALYKKGIDGRDTNEIEWYTLNQSVEVRSNDVEKLTALSREATELINQGIALESSSPEYFYTRLDELKIEMLAQATENARERAMSMAKATGNKIGLMRSAKMGVFQITPLNSNEVSDYGYNDTSSLDKKVTAVVSVAFAIE